MVVKGCRLIQPGLSRILMEKSSFDKSHKIVQQVTKKLESTKTEFIGKLGSDRMA